MLNLKEKIAYGNGKKLAALALIAILAATLPVFVFSSHKTKLYVNKNANGTQDGSVNHPYKTIGAAMSKAGKKTEIHIAKGTYKENVEIKKGVEIYGSDRDKVIIKAKHDHDAVVVMNDNTTLNGVTVEEGRNGIWVEKRAGVSITDCIIRDNSRNGIQIESDGTGKDREVYVSKSSIKDNGQNGILAGKRKLSLSDNEIYRNSGDGIVVAGGSKAWIAGNSIRENDLSGMKITLDGSNIWTKKNSIRKNKREGIEVNFYGGAGKINIAKSKIVLNGRYGIARAQRAAATVGLWAKYLIYSDQVELWGNKSGTVSPIFTF